MPPDALSILIVLHEPGLESWIDHVDAEAVVGVSGEHKLALYAGLTNSQAVVSRNVDPLRDFEPQLALLGQIGSRVADVVEMPKEEGATFAVVSGQQITDVVAGLRSTFIELALNVARVLAVG